MSIFVYRLYSGMEVVAEQVSDDESHYIVRSPQTIHIIPREQNQQGQAGTAQLVCSPFAPLAPEGENISIKKSDVAFCHQPIADVISLYRQATSSIIQAPAGALQHLKKGLLKG